MRHFVFSFLLLPVICQPVFASSVITIESTNLQKIYGWGICTQNRPDWGTDWVIAKNSAICDQAYGQLGATHLRIDLTHTCYTSAGINTGVSALGAVKEHILAATNRGMKYFISMWSPPAEMKDPQSVSGSVNGVDTHLQIDKEDIFVQRVTECIAWLKAQGCPLPDAFSFQNEPDYNPWYDGCVYTPEQYQRVAKKFRKSFDANNLADVKMHLADAGYQIPLMELLGNQSGDLKALDSDPELDKAATILSVHTYDMHNGQCETYNKNILERFCTAVKGRKQQLWMTEYSAMETTEDSWLGLLNTVRHFNRDMSTLGMNFWSYFMIWAAKDGLFLSGTTTVTKGPWFYVFEKIWKNVHQGAYVRNVISADTDLKGNWYYNCGQDFCAFSVNTDTMVLIVTNPLSSVKTLDIKGLTGDKAVLYTMNNGYVDNTPMVQSGPFTVANGTLSGMQFSANTINILISSNSGVAIYSSAHRRHTAKNGKGPFVFVDITGRIITRSFDRGKLSSGIYFVKRLDGAGQKVLRCMTFN